MPMCHRRMCRVLVQTSDSPGEDTTLYNGAPDSETFDFDICVEATDDDIMYAGYGYMMRHGHDIWNSAFHVQKLYMRKWTTVRWSDGIYD